MNETVWQSILDKEKNKDKEKEKGEEDLDLLDDETDEEDENELEEMDAWGDREFVSDVSGDEVDGLSDLEGVGVSASA